MKFNSDENIKSNRDTSLDAVCGLFIIYMITRHAFQWSGCRDDYFYKDSGNWLYMFLPWFFYKSGMFHKEGNTKVMIKHDAYKLLKPYILYTIIGSIIYFLFLYLHGRLHFTELSDTIRDIRIYGSCKGNVPLWFLPCLLLTKISVHTTDKAKDCRVLLFIAAIIFSYITSTEHFHYSHREFPQTLSAASTAIIFYMIGYYFKDRQYNRRIVVISALAYIVISLLCPSIFDIRINKVVNGRWTTAIVGSVTGIIVANNIFKAKVFQLSLLESVGRNSLTYYCSHWVLFYIVAIIFGYNNDNKSPNYMELFALLTTSAIILPLFTYSIKRLKTKKSLTLQSE